MCHHCRINLKILDCIMRFMVFWRSCVAVVLWSLGQWSERYGAVFMQNKISSVSKMHLKIASFSSYFIKQWRPCSTRNIGPILPFCLLALIGCRSHKVTGAHLKSCSSALLVDMSPELEGGRGRRRGWAVLSSRLPLDFCFGS